MYSNSETVQRADLVLPAAGWGEKEGTFINSERRLGHVKKVARAPGEALADFHIFQLVAQVWGCEALFHRWKSPEAVFQILKELSRGQPCDITGIADYAMLDAAGGIQWPFPKATEENRACCKTLAETSDETPLETSSNNGLLRQSSSTKFATKLERGVSQQALTSLSEGKRLFTDGRFYHPDGKARLLFEPPRPLPEAPDAEFPLLLLTGRGSAAQWHTGTRTEKSAVLRKLRPAAIYVEVNPFDADRLGLMPGKMVRVCSRRGSVLATAFITHTVPRGQAFIPMHYEAANQLTFAAFDPYSGQPAYKASAINIIPAEPGQVEPPAPVGMMSETPRWPAGRTE
jgi:assimilatory nitrate reductase catalytic subunit